MTETTTNINTTMSDHLNLINLVGRLGQAPETQYFTSGACLTKLSLAVNRGYKDESPDWFSLEIWGKIAEVAANYTTKGSLIAIQGELKLDEWIDKNTGNSRSKPVVKVHNLELLSSSQSSSNSPANNNDF